MLTRSRARSIGWAMILAICFAFTIALTFKVNAVKSQVRLTERKIAALQAEKGLLETEFETRANQQQLTALNDVEFGYQAPTAGQYLESERQLASLGKPRAPDAPQMIRVASAEPAKDDSAFPAMVNPLTGKALAAEPPADAPKAKARATQVAHVDRPEGLAARLGHVEQLSHKASPTAKAGLLSKNKARADEVAHSDSPARPAARSPRVERLSHVEKTPKPLKPARKVAKVALEE